MNCALRRLSCVAGLAIAAVVGGCASLPDTRPLPTTAAIAVSDETELGRMALAAQPDRDLTGFRLMPSGDNALTTRIDLARRAQRSLDAQYYQVDNDASGRFFLRSLRDAALRGVRVRLLIDDLSTAGEDPLLLGLAATPNLELRLFNPFPAGRDRLASRFAWSLFDLGRLNRRMHNKLFIADGAVAVAGGRNIGDEYFRQANDENYLDLDVVVVGALLARMGALFDLYWNSPHVRRIEDVARSSAVGDELARRFEEATAGADTPPPRPPAPNDVLGYGPFIDELRSGRLGLLWATAEAYADDPGRVVGRQVSYGGVPLLDVDSVRYNVREQMRRARNEVTLVSPYLIAGQEGREAIGEVVDRGVRLSLVTNSLGSTDAPLVYGAYRRQRADLLRQGVQIWELSSSRSSDSVRLGVLGSKVSRLHSKSGVFDGQTVFLGSMNLDPRSDKLNTEFGLIIRSREIAAQLNRLIDSLKQQGTYRVRLAADGSTIEWASRSGDTERVLTTEPDTDFCDRLKVDLLTPFVPESLL